MEILFIIGTIAVIAIVLKKKNKSNEKVEPVWNEPSSEKEPSIIIDKTIKKQFNYKKAKSLLTPAEVSFNHALQIAINDRFNIHSKVRLADVLEVDNHGSKSEWQKAFNQIKAKHLDFVLTDIKTSEILCAIELDDKSHKRKDRKERDEFLNDAMVSADIPLIRFDAKSSYDTVSIENAVSEKLGCLESAV
jgi:hypothetical protein